MLRSCGYGHGSAAAIGGWRKCAPSNDIVHLIGIPSKNALQDPMADANAGVHGSAPGGAAFLSGSFTQPQKRDASQIAMESAPSPPTRGRSITPSAQRQRRVEPNFAEKVKELEEMVAKLARQDGGDHA